MLDYSASGQDGGGEWPMLSALRPKCSTSRAKALSGAGCEMDYAELDDQTLMLLISRSHTDALSELYDRYSRLVYSLALNVLGDGAIAEEITLDVFTRIWEKADTYRSDQAKVSTWLTSITRNRAIDILRRQSVRPEGQSVSWADLSPSAEPYVDGLEDGAELAMQRERVRAAVGQLPDEQKQVLALAYFRGYTHREIAEMLAQPLGTVKTRIRLAMDKLRRMLAPDRVP
jgi:RNA polymerase sigma-70 factor (ECF subfamily)